MKDIGIIKLKTVDAFIIVCFDHDASVPKVEQCRPGLPPLTTPLSIATVYNSYSNILYEVEIPKREAEAVAVIELHGIPVSSQRGRWTPDIIEYLLESEEETP